MMKVQIKLKKSEKYVFLETNTVELIFKTSQQKNKNVGAIRLI